MKIILIGGLGFIGKEIIKNFSKQHEIIVITKKNEGIKKEKLKNIQIEFCSISESMIKNIIKKHIPDIVIDLVVFGGLKKCEENPVDAFTVNVFGMLNIIHGCLETKSKLIFLSSREVYGETQGKESKEEDRINPKNVLGITKMLGENLIKNAAENSELEFTILRITNVYGENMKAGIYQMIKNALDNNKIIVNGGNQILNLIHVNDVVFVIKKILLNNIPKNMTYNVGSTSNISLIDLVKIITDTLQIKPEIELRPFPKEEVLKFIPNISKIKKDIEWDEKEDEKNKLVRTIISLEHTLNKKP